jgi:hypothetical protein
MIPSFAVYPAGRGRGAVLETPNELSAFATISMSARRVKRILSNHSQRDDLRNALGQNAPPMKIKASGRAAQDRHGSTSSYRYSHTNRVVQ